jgi:hypothetical protein
MNGTEKQITLAASLLENFEKWVNAARKDIPPAQLAGFEAMFAPVRGCADAAKLIAALRDLPKVTDAGTHYLAGSAAHEINAARWQIVLQDAVLALR